MRFEELLKGEFLKVVEEQLQNAQPPAVIHTLQRLLADGYSPRDARLLIAQCVAAEYVAAMQQDSPFDYERYAQCLEALPNHQAAFKFSKDISA